MSTANRRQSTRQLTFLVLYAEMAKVLISKDDLNLSLDLNLPR